MTGRAHAAGGSICLALAVCLLLSFGSSAWGQQLIVLDFDIGTLELEDLELSLYMGDGWAPILVSEPSFIYRPLDMVGPRSGGYGWAMGGAHVAEASGLAAVSWNPAGLGWLERPDLAWDLSWARSSGTTSGFPDTFNVPEVALLDVVRYEVGLQGQVRYDLMGGATSIELPGGRRLVGGLSFRRYLNTTYPEEIVADLSFQEVGSFPVTVAYDGDEEGGVDAAAATVALEAIPGLLSIGANLNYLNGVLRMSEETIVATGGPQQTFGSTTLRLKYKGIAADLGLQLRREGLGSLGIRYTPGYTVEVTKGKYMVMNLPDVGSVVAFRGNARIAAYDMKIPSLLSIGGAFRPLHWLTVAAETNIQNWNELRIKYHDAGRPQDATLPMRNVTSYHFGFEGRLLSYREIDLPVRVGFQVGPLSMAALDPEVEDWTGGDIDSHAFTFGIGFETGSLRYDLGYQVIDYKLKKFYFDVPADPFMNPQGTFVDVDRRISLIRIGATLSL